MLFMSSRLSYFFILLFRHGFVGGMVVVLLSTASCRQHHPSDAENAIQIPNVHFVAYMKHYLDDGYSVRMIPKGNSMLPTLSNGKEVVTLQHIDVVKPGDVVLASTIDGHYVIHRVMSVEGNVVTLKGDHNKTTETAMITNVIAKMVAVEPVSNQNTSKTNETTRPDTQFMANPSYRIDAVDSLAWMVDTLRRQVDMHKAIVFNEPALLMWKQLRTQKFGLEDMKNILTGAYEVDEKTALNDCKKLLAEWKTSGLVIEAHRLP